MNTAVETVFVVDDARNVRAGLSRVLSAAGYPVREFESAEQFLEEQDAKTPGCLLLDLCMPGMSGLQLQRALVGSPNTRPIVFLTGAGDITTSVQAMKEGAVDFLTKPIETPKLLVAIAEALQRDRKQRAENAICSMIRRNFGTLTGRESQVMRHVIRGRLNKQIAVELGIGEKTVKVHRERVMLKMRVRSVAELVRLDLRALGQLTSRHAADISYMDSLVRRKDGVA